MIITPEIENEILRLLKKGKWVEIRNEKGNLVVIAIERKVAIKKPIEVSK